MCAVVLVVEDDPNINRMLSRLLEQDGLPVLSASNGEQAYRLIRANPVRLVLLDLEMPGLGGNELLVLLSVERSRLPVIVVASEGNIDSERLKRFPSVRKVMPKPFHADDLVRAVRDHLPKTA